MLQPSAAYTPESEQEVLEILNRHRGQSIRAVGRLHSWSEAILGDGVQLDLRRLKDVVLESDGDQFVATVGAGCQIKRLLKELNRDGATLPSLGLITVQTIAGAISTGTHGSGRHSMSHYVEEVRLARYDESTGQAFIDELSAGEPLLAARCSLGSLGTTCRSISLSLNDWKMFWMLKNRIQSSSSISFLGAGPISFSTDVSIIVNDPASLNCTASTG